MSGAALAEALPSGFSLGNAARFLIQCFNVVKLNNFFFRNTMLEKMGVRPPVATKTGTTIVGLMFKVCSFVDFMNKLAYSEHNYLRMELLSEQILVQLLVPWLPISFALN